MERQIGERFDFGGVTLEVVESGVQRMPLLQGLPPL